MVLVITIIWPQYYHLIFNTEPNIQRTFISSMIKHKKNQIKSASAKKDIGIKSCTMP